MLTNLNVRTFQWIHAGAGCNYVVDSVAVFFALGGPWIMVAMFFVSWFFVNQNKKIFFLEALWAAVTGLMFNQIIGLFYFHPRPFMQGLCKPLFFHVAETSFPSDHASLLFAAAFYLLMYRRLMYYGIFLFAVAILTAWGRVYCGVHFPFDMAGSLVVGFVSAGLIRVIRGSLHHFNDTLIFVSDKLTCRIAGVFKSNGT